MTTPYTPAFSIIIQQSTDATHVANLTHYCPIDFPAIKNGYDDEGNTALDLALAGSNRFVNVLDGEDFRRFTINVRVSPTNDQLDLRPETIGNLFAEEIGADELPSTFDSKVLSERLTQELQSIALYELVPAIVHGEDSNLVMSWLLSGDDGALEDTGVTVNIVSLDDDATSEPITPYVELYYDPSELFDHLIEEMLQEAESDDDGDDEDEAEGAELAAINRLLEEDDTEE